MEFGGGGGGKRYVGPPSQIIGGGPGLLPPASPPLPMPMFMSVFFIVSSDSFNKIEITFENTHDISSLVGRVQYTCPVVPLCIVDASLSHYVGH